MEKVIKKGIKSNFLSPLLSIPGMATVHSLFDNSLNLLYRNQLIHIGKRDEGISAFGMTLEDEVVTELLENVHKDARIRIRNGEFVVYTRIRTWIIQHDSFNEYDCRIPVLSSWTNEETNQLLGILEEKGVLQKNGLLEDKGATELIEAFLHTNLSDLAFQESFMKQMIGRGIGLTPSGDDCLMGILLGICSHPPYNEWKNLLQEVLTERRTTAVSEAYYQAMLQGFTSSYFVELNDCLRSHSFERIPFVIDQIAKYGHTSGWDTLLGLYLYYKTKQ